MTMAATAIPRTTFTTSREFDFCTKKELTAQTGHSPDEWPAVIVKELVDNGLDACEEAGIVPEIDIIIDDDGITIADNGLGMPAETISSVMDFASRTSSREAYAAPDRGAQGNAMKTIWAMPFALDGTSGRVDIETRGERHEMTFAVDQIRQKPTIKRAVHSDENVRNGTTVKIWWPADYLQMLSDSSCIFLQQVLRFGALNPHLTLFLEWFGEKCVTRATDSAWVKWRPSDPSPAGWYTEEEFDRLVGAHIAYDQDRGKDRSVRELVKMFRGLTSTAKQKAVLGATGLSREPLSALANGNGLRRELTSKLLAEMKRQSKPPKPAVLGLIGKEHIRSTFIDLGCDPGTFEYRKKAIAIDDVPTVIEVAFACMEDEDEERTLIAGINWSAAIRNPFRNLGSAPNRRNLHGDGLDDLPERQRAGADEPVVIFVHLASPGVRYTDRGKSAVAIDRRVGRHIQDMVTAATAKWCKARRQEDRRAEQRFNRQRLTRRENSRSISLKDAVFKKMEDGVRVTSGNQKYVFPKRNLFYTIRDLIQELTAKELTWDWFQGCVNQYEHEHGPVPGMYCDPRGYLIEPHTNKSIPLGTREVDDYDIPDLLYDKVLYVEKKGQQPIFQKARLAEKYDLAIICAEGYATRAVKTLLSAAQTDRKMTVLCLHDADPYGYNIARTLREATALCPQPQHRRDRYRPEPWRSVGHGLADGDLLPQKRATVRSRSERPGEGEVHRHEEDRQ